MSTFCGNNGSLPALSDSDLNASQSPSLLPGAPPTTDINGLVSEEWLQGYVNRLEKEGVIPKPLDWEKLNAAPFDSPGNKDPLSQYTEAEKKLHTRIKEEYCFIETRYQAALNNFLTSVTSSTISDSQTPAIVQQKLQVARNLNRKLILFTQIVNAVSKYRYTQTKDFQDKINGLNTELRERRRQLIKQYDILKTETAASDLNSKLVDYTTEKNKASSHLLALQGILNITALAMLFYVARN